MIAGTDYLWNNRRFLYPVTAAPHMQDNVILFYVVYTIELVLYGI